MNVWRYTFRSKDFSTACYDLLIKSLKAITCILFCFMFIKYKLTKILLYNVLVITCLLNSIFVIIMFPFNVTKVVLEFIKFR